jgi:nitrate reductase assembly molybdenum cofactor insertion protein NarJ
MKPFKEIKQLPDHLQPKILSAVAFINSASPDMTKAAERINRLAKHLSDREMMYVMSLLVFDKLIDMVKDSDEFKDHVSTMKERTIN